MCTWGREKGPDIRHMVPIHLFSQTTSATVIHSTDSFVVYNCRTTNSWAMDLAFTATFFPHCGLTFGILFGCPFSIEKQIVNRLSYATKEAGHPLLIPGIFAELERNRQVHIIESAIDEVETRILTVDSSPEEMDAMSTSMKETENRAKRAQWLDTTYLRNQLVNWNTQLKKLAGHSDELSNIDFRQQEPDKPRSCDSGQDDWLKNEECTGTSRAHLRRVGVKIRDRVQEIIDEYDAKIRDCTMRVDGMAMATQWVRYTISWALSNQASEHALILQSAGFCFWESNA